MFSNRRFASPIMQAMQQRQMAQQPQRPMTQQPAAGGDWLSAALATQPMGPQPQGMPQQSQVPFSMAALNPNAFNAPGSINYGPVQPQGMSRAAQNPIMQAMLQNPLGQIPGAVGSGATASPYPKQAVQQPMPQPAAPTPGYGSAPQSSFGSRSFRR